MRKVIVGVLSFPEDAGAGSGGAAVIETGVASGSAASGAAGSGTPTPSTKWEDTPQYKGQVAELQKERKARQLIEANQTRLQAEVDEWKRKTGALSGVVTPSKDQADENAIRERFKQLFPHLADLTAEDVEAIRESKGQAAQTTQFVEQQWSNHHSAMLKDVHAGIAKEIGDLNERQVRKLNAAYVAQCEHDKDFMKRIENGDKTATAQFVTEYLEDFIEPVKKKQNAADASRFRAVPNGKDRSVPIPGERPIDPNDNDAVMKMLVASRKGQFGRNR